MWSFSMVILAQAGALLSHPQPHTCTLLPSSTFDFLHFLCDECPSAPLRPRPTLRRDSLSPGCAARNLPQRRVAWACPISTGGSRSGIHSLIGQSMRACRCPKSTTFTSTLTASCTSRRTEMPVRVLRQTLVSNSCASLFGSSYQPLYCVLHAFDPLLNFTACSGEVFDGAEGDQFIRMCSYLDSLVQLVRPKRLLYIAIDESHRAPR